MKWGPDAMIFVFWSWVLSQLLHSPLSPSSEGSLVPHCFLPFSSVAQSCPTLCNPMDCSLPGSSIHGIFSGKSTGVGCHWLLQGIFLTQGSNPGLPHCSQMLLPSEPPGKSDKLESILKSRDITLPTKVHIVKSMVFPVFLYKCESWFIKKGWVSKNWCFWIGKDSWMSHGCKEIKQWILKEINPEYSLEGLFLELKFQYFGHPM